MATKKKPAVKKTAKKVYFLKNLRMKKGFATLKSFAEAIAKNLGKTEEKDLKNIGSLFSRYETGAKKPGPEYFEAIKQVLTLSEEEVKSINKSIGRTTAPVVVKKKKPQYAKKKSDAKETTAEQKKIVKPGTITPESASKFSNAVAALGEISLERASQLLQDLATK